MAKSYTTSAIAVVSKTAFEQGLKAAGFRRQGNHLHRQIGSIINAFHFQASQWGSAESGQFTINLVVTSSTLYRCLLGSPLPKNPATALYPFQIRVGDLLAKPRDIWWPVTSHTDVAELSDKISRLLIEDGLAFLARYRNAQTFLQSLREGREPSRIMSQASFVHAILAKEAGEIEEATRLLRAAFENPVFEEQARHIARELDIVLPE